MIIEAKLTIFALDDAVARARRKTLGDESGERFVYSTYSKNNDLSPLIALVLANALAASPTPEPTAWWDDRPSGHDPIFSGSGVMFPTYSTRDRT